MKDLLERLRDLVIVAAVEDAFERRLVGGADDQRGRVQAQADRIGLAALTRCTELVATGIAEMKGPTPPRLHLELVCAKLLLPGAHGDELSLAARLERMERRFSIAGAVEVDEAPAQRSAAPPAARSGRSASTKRPRTTAASSAEPSPRSPATVEANAGPEPATPAEPAPTATPRETVPSAPGGAEAEAAPAGAAVDDGSATPAPHELAELRRLWPNVLNRVKDYRRVTWAQLFEKSDILGVDDKQLQIGLRDVGSHRAFSQGGHDEIVRQALIDVVGLDLVVVAILDPSVSAASSSAALPADEAIAPTAPPAAAAEARAAAQAVEGPVVGKDRAADTVDDEVTLDDPDAEDDGLAGHELVARQLGGTVIGEIDHA